MSTQPRSFITPEQYLALERRAEFKSEYFDGEMYAMAGAGRVHNLLATRACAIVDNSFRDRDCEVYGSDMRVCVFSATGLYTYPDVSAVCGEPRFLDGELDTLLNPKVLMEVLSRSTETYDRVRKFQRYKAIESFVQYVLIASERVQVDLLTRDAAGRWNLASMSDPRDIVDLTSIECSFSVAELYQKTGLLTRI